MGKLNVQRIKSLPEGRHSDGGGLYLRRRTGRADSWEFRYTDPATKKRRAMVLGSGAALSLAAARAKAAQMALDVSQGQSPAAPGKAAPAARSGVPTLAEIVPRCFEARKAELHEGGRPGMWLSPLENHILPALGNLPVDQIDQHKIVDALEPIWRVKVDTAGKAIGRLNICLKYAAALGLNVDLNAVLLAKVLLGKQPKSGKHFNSMPWRDVPDFYKTLGTSQSELMLRLLILTGLRPGNINEMKWEYIYGRDRVSHNEYPSIRMPAIDMKNKKAGDFWVPITPQIETVLELVDHHIKRVKNNPYMFPVRRHKVATGGKYARQHVNPTAMTECLRRKKINYHAHGFRSSLRMWALENSIADERIAEMMLHHSFGSDVSRAYARGDLFDSRIVPMEKWSNHVAPMG